MAESSRGTNIDSLCAFKSHSRIKARKVSSTIIPSFSITGSQQSIRLDVKSQTRTSLLQKLTQLHMAGKFIGKSGGKMILSPDLFSHLVLLNPPTDPETVPVTPAPVQLVYFAAAWCGPCRLTHPVVKEVGKEFASRINIYEINTDDMPDTAESQGVASIPTIQLYSGGILKETIIGCVAKNVLAASVSKLLEEVTPNE